MKTIKLSGSLSAVEMTTQEKIDMVMAIAFIVSLAIRAYYSPYHY